MVADFSILVGIYVVDITNWYSIFTTELIANNECLKYIRDTNYDLSLLIVGLPLKNCNVQLRMQTYSLKH